MSPEDFRGMGLALQMRRKISLLAIAIRYGAALRKIS
jgi:hypothetical protein